MLQPVALAFMTGAVIVAISWGQELGQPTENARTDRSRLESEGSRLTGFNPVQPRRGKVGGLRSVPILFVDQSATPGGDGTSWATAYRDLQQALADAQVDAAVVEIRVAAGVYHPDAGSGNRDSEFALWGQSDLALLGGFPAGGGEPEDRNPELHLTVLSGDIANDDVVTFERLEFDDNLVPTNLETAGVRFENVQDNCFTVVGASGADGTVLVDGFTITGGHDPERGGGMTASGAALSLRNVTFAANSSGDQGGGLWVFNTTGRMVIDRCTFERNVASSQGGGCWADSSDISFTENTFVENSSPNGGGLYLDPTQASQLDSCMFIQNVSASRAAGLSVAGSGGLNAHGLTFVGNRAADIGGALWAYRKHTFMGCTFSENLSGSDGGAVWLDQYSTMINCVFTGNAARNNGGGAYVTYHGLFTDCMFEGNTTRGTGGGVWSDGCDFENCSFIANEAVGNGGGAFLGRGNGLMGCRVINNEADASGGGMWLEDDYNSLLGCALIGNLAGDSGGAVGASADAVDHGFLGSLTIVSNHASSVGGIHGPEPLTIIDVILWDNTDTVSAPERAQLGGAFHNISYSTIMGLSDHYGPHNLGLDPRFADPIGEDNMEGTGDEDFRLTSLSPAIDAGSSSSIHVLMGSHDLLGQPRHVGFGGTPMDVIDMGAIETQDCDADGVADFEAIMAGTTADCTEDGIPDSCQVGSLLLAAAHKIHASEPEVTREFGYAVDLDGDTLVVSGKYEVGVEPWAGTVFVYDARSLQLVLELNAEDGAAGDYMGNSLAISGDVVVAGAPGAETYDYDNDFGAAYVFDASTGQQMHKLRPPSVYTYGRFGISVDTDGQVAVVGAYQAEEDGTDAGSAYVFDVASGEMRYRLQTGETDMYDYFGASVAIDAGRILVGAPGRSDVAFSNGCAYIFDAATGSLVHTLLPGGASANQRFGGAVAIDGDVVVIGTPGAGGSNLGACYVFDAVTGLQIARLTADDAAAGDEFGSRVAVGGGLIAVGAENDGVAGMNYAGSIYLFDEYTRQFLVRLNNADAESYVYFGSGAAVSDGRLVAGTRSDREFATGTGSATLFVPGFPDENQDGVPDTCTCAADFNMDGTLDFFDLQNFLNAFTAADSSADLNADGDWNFFDVQSYLNLFSRGCP